MALGDPYADLGDLKTYLKIQPTNTKYNAALTDALNSASSEIERHTGRQFNLAASATPRVYEPEQDWMTVRTDDFATLNTLVVQVSPDNSGNFTQTLTSSQYEAYPYNGVVDGQPGWPYYRLRSTGGAWFPRLPLSRRASVQVTAQWGWPAVPAPIKQSCMIIAAQTYRLADAPWGVAGMTEFGTAVRIRDIPMVREKLRPFVKYPVLGG